VPAGPIDVSLRPRQAGAPQSSANIPASIASSAKRTSSGATSTSPTAIPWLFNTPGADGLKTGHIEASGYGLVGSAIRGGQRIILVAAALPARKTAPTKAPA